MQSTFFQILNDRHSAPAAGRRERLRELGFMAYHAGLSGVITGLSDPAADVRETAARSLGWMGFGKPSRL
jgi:hypothetical protein